MKGYVFRNENCLETCKYMIENKIKVDCILTSPPYNISKSVNSTKAFNEHQNKYKYYNDNKKIDEYIENMLELFYYFRKVLKRGGCMLLNYSYANTDSGRIMTPTKLIELIFLATERLNLRVADIITWKKGNALPNNASPNKCTRICEYVFVLVRSSDYDKFKANKKISKIDAKGNKKYKSDMYNFIEAKNNDGANPYNKATFSTEFVQKLLQMYVRNDSIVYDPFGGTGTTAIGCYKENRNIRCICSELDPEQVKYSKDRLKKVVRGE